MDSLDKFIKSVAWKFPKGYPDINDPKDKTMLLALFEAYTGEKQVLKEPEQKKLPLEDATRVLFELEEQIMLGNIPIELLQQVVETAYNQTWSSDTIEQ